MDAKEEKRLLLQLSPVIRAFVQDHQVLELEELINTLDDLLWARRMPVKVTSYTSSIPLGKNREIVKVREIGGVTYRQEKVRCGKQRCRCASGALHGPYWYGYYRDKGARLRSTYIGKQFCKLEQGETT